MKARPILFAAPMVRAILDERKNQTRRVMKPQPNAVANGIAIAFTPDDQRLGRLGISIKCPYGQPGDLLWVKETWSDLTETHGQHWERFNPDTGFYERGIHPFPWYRADGEQPDIGNGVLKHERWRPSIHMPRWASRLTLRITDVRVQRLQDISESDAMAEGVSECDGLLDEVALCTRAKQMGIPATESRVWFSQLWESINGPDSWDANPYVWALTFETIKANVDRVLSP